MIDNLFRISNNFNDLDKLKIYNLISQKGGGNYDIMMLIFAIIILVIGAICLAIPFLYGTTTAIISSISSDNMYKYINVNYYISSTNYNKKFTVSNSDNYSLNSSIMIYYDKLDPTTVTLSLTNYYIMAAVLFVVGASILYMKNIVSPKKVLQETSIYDTDSNLDDIKII